MTKDQDAELTLMLRSPDAYSAYAKGFGRALASGAPANEAAAACGLTAHELSGALGVLKRARRGVRSGARLAKRTGRRAAVLHPIALSAKAARLTAKGLALATGPLRRRIFRAFFGKLTLRRARLLSWRERRSLQPSRAEQARARAWAVAYVKRRGLFGKLAGAMLSGEAAVGEAASSALITASIPVLVELARRALKAAERQGAPHDPRSERADEAAPEE